MHRSVTSQANVTPTGGAATEQVIATIPVPLMNDNPLVSSIVVDAVVNYTGGSASTAAVFRVRRGSLTGAQVGPNFTAPVSPSGYAINVVDMPLPSPLPAQYVVTVQQTAATTNGTVNYLAGSITAS